MNKVLSYTINWQVSLGRSRVLWLTGKFSVGGFMELSSVMFCMCYSSGQWSHCSLCLIIYHSKINAWCNWYSPCSVSLYYIVLSVCLVYRFSFLCNVFLFDMWHWPGSAQLECECVPTASVCSKLLCAWWTCTRLSSWLTIQFMV